ncbi:MAG: hypothetical protein WA004_07390, partial [Saprospiraceae bacterium]
DKVLAFNSPCEFSQPGGMQAGFRQSGDSLVFLVLFQQGKSTFQAKHNIVLLFPTCVEGDFDTTKESLQIRNKFPEQS